MQTEAKKDNLKSDIKDVIKDSQSLLEATASDVSDKTKEVRKDLTNRFEQAKGRWEKFSENIKDKAVAGAEGTDRLIRDKPYQSLGIALGVGLLIGALLNQRES